MSLSWCQAPLHDGIFLPSLGTSAAAWAPRCHRLSVLQTKKMPTKAAFRSKWVHAEGQWQRSSKAIPRLCQPCPGNSCPSSASVLGSCSSQAGHPQPLSRLWERFAPSLTPQPDKFFLPQGWKASWLPPGSAQRVLPTSGGGFSTSGYFHGSPQRLNRSSMPSKAAR